MSPDDPRHGTYAGGRVHRDAGELVCSRCRDAEARYERARQLDILNGRPRTLPAVGAQRRLRALATLGHTWTRIAEALGMTAAGAHHLATRPRAYMRATTTAKVDALYDAWSMTLPPETVGRERKAASYARTVARKHGWAPPLAWEGIDIDLPSARPDLGERRFRTSDVDEVAVRRVLEGDRTIRLNHADRREVVTRARARGWSLRDIESITGITRPDRYLANDKEAA